MLAQPHWSFVFNLANLPALQREMNARGDQMATNFSYGDHSMKFKMIALTLVLALGAWAQTPNTAAPTQDKSADQPSMSCCHGKNQAKDGMSCCKHDAKDTKDGKTCCKHDGKDASCCAGKDGKMACMKDDKNKSASCCGNADCCKDGKACCDKSKDAATTSMKCCGDKCERHAHAGAM
jgi:hypothetical protein